MRLCLTILVLLMATSLYADTIEGHPRVVDGDTLAFGMQRVRLSCIDAPEARQQCERRDGRLYDCGRVATDALRQRIGFRSIRCEWERRDPYGRLLAVCYAADGTDLNGWLVFNGYALADQRYSWRYTRQESSARLARASVHAGRFVEPWRWRHGER